MSGPVRIGIDARELLGEVTGVGRYLGELLTRWTRRSDASSREFILYSPQPLQIPFSGKAPTQRVLRGTPGTWWEQTALRRAVRADKPDIFFAPAYTAPLALGMPLAVTIHDVSFMAHPEWFRPRERWRRRFLTRRLAATASLILTDSEFSRSEIVSHLRIPASRLQVIPPGTPQASNRSPIPSGNAREPLVLYVGTRLNRRHLPELLAAFAKVSTTYSNARLVIVGADRSWPAEDLTHLAADLGVSRTTKLHSYLPAEDLRRLYARASVFVFLSEYEGFGLTPLEALAAGVPVIVGDTPVAREVYGSAATYVAVRDVESTAAAIARYLASPTAAEPQLAEAPAILNRYSWDRAADETLATLERIAR